MEIRTHRTIDPAWSGHCLEATPGRAIVELTTRPEMAADEHGLVHGAFAFSAADYAAMLAVNEPTVVLGSATMRFHAPARVGEVLRAEAVVQKTEGNKRVVRAEVRRGATLLLEAELLCLVPSKHVLEA